MAESFIEISNLRYRYGESEIPAIADVNLTVEKGEFSCIVGPSGCGKSTLLTILSGLAVPETGSVRIDGKAIYEAGQRTGQEMPRCGYMFQDSRLLPWRTVRDNISIALQAAEVPQDEWEDKVLDLLRMLRIEPFVDAWPMNLSGGQRHRVAIARALAIAPAFILMDEPFSTLDEVTARFLRTELLEVWNRTGTTIVFVTHSIREAVYLSDTVNLMSRGPGRILECRPVQVSRPRAYEDPALAQVEGEIVETVLEAWGYYEDAISEPGSTG